MAQVGRRADRRRRAAARDLDRQGRHGGPEPRRGRRREDHGAGRGDGRRGNGAGRDRARRSRARRARPGRGAPRARNPGCGRRVRGGRDRDGRAHAGDSPRACSDPRSRGRTGRRQRPHVRLARRRPDRLRARRRPERRPGHRHGRPRDEEGHPGLRRIRRLDGGSAGSAGGRASGSRSARRSATSSGTDAGTRGGPTSAARPGTYRAGGACATRRASRPPAKRWSR